MLRSVKYGLCGAVVAGLVGGTVAFTTTGDKTVHLVVDGTSRTIHTTADEVGPAVTKAGFHPGPHDLLAPSATSHLNDGATIVLKRGRLLHLSVDGEDRAVWTTAPTVAQALGDLGFSTSDFISVSRSQRLPLGVTDIDVRTPKPVTVVHDGKTTHLTTTDATVGQLLADLNLTVGPNDRLSIPENMPLQDGSLVKLTRVEHKVLSRREAIPFGTKTVKDSSLQAGNTKVITPGQNGVRQLRWAAVYVDGKLVGKTPLRSVVLDQPTARVQKVGTKASTPNTPNAPAPSPGSNQAIARSMLGSYGWGDDQYSCLVQMWTRESGWRTDAANPSGAYGIPQALPGDKMASAGPNWQTDARTQIKWGLDYIRSRYNSPCEAWGLWQQQGWY